MKRYIDKTSEIKMCNVLEYITKYLRVKEIEKKYCQLCMEERIPIESVSDKLIMSLQRLNRNNHPIQVDTTKNLNVAKNIVTLENVFGEYLKKIGT